MLERIREIGKAAIKSGEFEEKGVDMRLDISPNREDINEPQFRYERVI